MVSDSPRWTLENLVDFEQATSSSKKTPPAVRNSVIAAIRGLEGAAARRVGLHVWLVEMKENTLGKKFTGALAVVGCGLSVLTFLAGISAVLGIFDRDRGGIHVALFLAICIGGQWLILLFGIIGWVMRGRNAEGFSGLQAYAGRLARRLAGDSNSAGWNKMLDVGGALRAAIIWRLARMAQAAGIFFNIGILSGLGGLVMVRHIGFFWETTTELAMSTFLETAVEVLASPWVNWWPQAAPDRATILGSRWLPGQIGTLAPGPGAWWEFLLMATLVWGLLPRLLLWVLAWKAGHHALGRLDFQGRSHRALWREITHTERVITDEPPLDGVLVLDVGGSGLTEQALRPFMLSHLRVHPTAWQSTAVLDMAAEKEAARSLAHAPAGVVLLAEGWALSPPRMMSLHSNIRSRVGLETPIRFLVANVGSDQQPIAATIDERQQWTRFVDSLRDPQAEIFFFEKC